MQVSGRGYIKMVGYWILSLFLVIFAWTFPLLTVSSTTSAIVLAVMVVSYALLCLLIERGLAYSSFGRVWRYRLAFIISALIGLLQVVTYWAIGETFRFSIAGTDSYPLLGFIGILIWIILTTSGAFIGALLATSMNEGLLEVNTPPASQTMRIYQQHLLSIGVPGAEPRATRWFDVSMSCIGLVLSAPVWIAGAFLVWLEDPGPILFVKNSTGKGGVNFRLYKFRTMALAMEKNMALVQTQEVEANTQIIGRILRKTALDELPQLINILKGEMSFVGPRPHRTPLVALYLQQMPEFAERHRVLPGLAGLAQVSGDFYMTPRQKLRFDRLYIRHQSLGFDIKLMFLAFLITFWYRWQADWNGRLPRKLLHSGRGSRE